MPSTKQIASRMLLFPDPFKPAHEVINSSSKQARFNHGSWPYESKPLVARKKLSTRGDGRLQGRHRPAPNATTARKRTSDGIERRVPAIDNCTGCIAFETIDDDLLNIHSPCSAVRAASSPE